MNSYGVSSTRLREATTASARPPPRSILRGEQGGRGGGGSIDGPTTATAPSLHHRPPRCRGDCASSGDPSQRRLLPAAAPRTTRPPCRCRRPPERRPSTHASIIPSVSKGRGRHDRPHLHSAPARCGLHTAADETGVADSRTPPSHPFPRPALPAPRQRRRKKPSASFPPRRGAAGLRGCSRKTRGPPLAVWTPALAMPSGPCSCPAG